MKFEEYKREIELIKKQNCTEQELYSIIACLIRGQKNSKSISLRDVSNRRRTESTQGLVKQAYGISGYPDFVILSEEFNGEELCRKNMLGAIEAKYIGCELREIKDDQQLQGHVLCFNKVLHTNGLVWRYYEYSVEEENNIKIEQLQNALYSWREKGKYPWDKDEKKLFELVKPLKWKWCISLIEDENEDSDKMTWKKSEWKKLQDKLSTIEWEL